MASNVHIDAIPDEILIQIFSYLSLEELVTLPHVSQHWKEICQDAELWRERCLTIEWCSTDIDEMTLIKKAPQLRNVSFCRNTKGAVFRCLYNTCRNIKALEFGSTQKLSYSTLKTLVDKLPLIERLTISEEMLSNKKLARAVSSMVNLKKLTLASSYDINKELSLRVLSNGCPSLQDLDLSYCYCDLYDLECLLQAKKDQLTSLSIRWSMKGKRSVTPCLKVCGSKLEKLTLVDYDLLHEETESAFNDLQQMVALKDFNAWGIQGPASSIANLFLSGRLSALQRLQLDSSDTINDGVVTAICKNCPQLEQLFLEKVILLTDNGLRYIQCCPLLHTLNLSFCDNLGSNTLTFIARCPRIRKLYLEDLDLKKLESGLNHLLNLSNLCELSFSGCSNMELAPLSSIPNSCRFLKKLRLGSWRSKDRSVLDKLESSMPYCKFEWYLYDEDEEENPQGEDDGAQDQDGDDNGAQGEDEDVRCRDAHSGNCDADIDECSNWNLFIFDDDGSL